MDRYTRRDAKRADHSTAMYFLGGASFDECVHACALTVVNSNIYPISFFDDI